MMPMETMTPMQWLAQFGAIGAIFATGTISTSIFIVAQRRNISVLFLWAGGVVVSFSAFYAGGRGFDSPIRQS